MKYNNTSFHIHQKFDSRRWTKTFSFLSNFKLIPQLDQYPTIVNFSQTVPGKTLILVLFSLGLILNDISHWKELSIVFLALSLFPKYRNILIVIATLYWLAKVDVFYFKRVQEVAQELGTFSAIDWTTIRLDILLAIFLFCTVFYKLAFHFRDSFVLRRPVATLIILNIVIISVACYAPLPDIFLTYLWAFIFIFQRFIWFLAYSLLDIRSKQPTPFFYQLGYFQAFWQGGYVGYPLYLPIPKGAGYLKQIEAKTPEQLAVCQLKGLKLLYWAFILFVGYTIYYNIVYGATNTMLFSFNVSLNIPTLSTALYASVNGNPLPWYMGWLSVFATLFNAIFYISVTGHIIIASVRMAGFNALRNTYKPLQAKTLVDFWNRYVYYFKELLVEFFFYPAFFRYFRQWPRFRLFFATLCAAGFGNVLFHFFYAPQYFFKLGIWNAFIAFQVYFFYGLLLGCGIGISQIRNMKNRGNFPWYRRWITGPLCVFGFFSFIIIFDSTRYELTIFDHFRFAASLFGLQI